MLFLIKLLWLSQFLFKCDVLHLISEVAKKASITKTSAISSIFPGNFIKFSTKWLSDQSLCAILIVEVSHSLILYFHLDNDKSTFLLVC